MMGEMGDYHYFGKNTKKSNGKTFKIEYFGKIKDFAKTTNGYKLIIEGFVLVNDKYKLQGVFDEGSFTDGDFINVLNISKEDLDKSKKIFGKDITTIKLSGKALFNINAFYEFVIESVKECEKILHNKVEKVEFFIKSCEEVLCLKINDKYNIVFDNPKTNVCVSKIKECLVRAEEKRLKEMMNNRFYEEEFNFMKDNVLFDDELNVIATRLKKELVEEVIKYSKTRLKRLLKKNPSLFEKDIVKDIKKLKSKIAKLYKLLSLEQNVKSDSTTINKIVEKVINDTDFELFVFKKI